MKAIFMGRKPASCAALEYLIEQGVEIVGVVTLPKEENVYWKQRLVDTAESHNLRILSDEWVSSELEERRIDVDLVISYLYWKKIQKPLIEVPRVGCINFHPAPLPEYRGLGGYNFAIYDELDYWGVSVHFVNEKIDEGDIIEVTRFGIDSSKETAYSLEQKTQKQLLELFKRTMDSIVGRSQLKRTPQGKGKYINREEFERLRKIKADDTSEEIDKKIRAFWFPPYDGAYIEVDSKQYTLVNEKVLNELALMLHKK